MTKIGIAPALQVYDETEPDSADKPVLGEKGRRYKKVNWMKGAFLSADKILTVSPTYAEEIAANESQGVELDSIIRYTCLELGSLSGAEAIAVAQRTFKYAVS